MRQMGGRGRGRGVIPSPGVVNVSAVDSERTEDGVVRTWKAGRERRMKGMRQVRKQRQGYRGMETDGWRGLVVEGGGSHSVDGWHASERGELRRAAPRTRKRARERCKSTSEGWRHLGLVLVGVEAGFLEMLE